MFVVTAFMRSSRALSHVDPINRVTTNWLDECLLPVRQKHRCCHEFRHTGGTPVPLIGPANVKMGQPEKQFRLFRFFSFFGL